MVSVVMCTYNGARYIGPQLDSILAQSHPASEIIVQDDRSTDGTLALLQDYAARYPQIKVFVKEERAGINDNFFKAMDRAQGDFIAISDQDDIWAPDKLEKQLAAIGENFICFHPSPNFQGDDLSTLSPVDPRPVNATMPRLFYNGPVLGHSILMRRDYYQLLRQRISWETIQFCGESMYYDSLLSFVAAMHRRIVYLGVPLSFHRRLETSASRGVKKKDLSSRSLSNFLQMIWKNLNPRRRRMLRPVADRRMVSMLRLMDGFPELASELRPYRRMAESFLKHSLWGDLQFIASCLSLRRELFITPQDKAPVMLLRALMHIVTIYESYDLYYSFMVEGRRDR